MSPELELMLTTMQQDIRETRSDVRQLLITQSADTAVQDWRGRFVGSLRSFAAAAIVALIGAAGGHFWPR